MNRHASVSNSPATRVDPLGNEALPEGVSGEDVADVLMMPVEELRVRYGDHLTGARTRILDAIRDKLARVRSAISTCPGPGFPRTTHGDEFIRKYANLAGGVPPKEVMVEILGKSAGEIDTIFKIIAMAQTGLGAALQEISRVRQLYQQNGRLSYCLDMCQAWQKFAKAVPDLHPAGAGIVQEIVHSDCTKRCQECCRSMN